jgi:hypothetical protein
MNKTKTRKYCIESDVKGQSGNSRRAINFPKSTKAKDAKVESNIISDLHIVRFIEKRPLINGQP